MASAAGARLGRESPGQGGVTSAKACPGLQEQWAGPAERCAGGWMGALAARPGRGRGGDVTGRRSPAGARVGKSGRRRRSLKAASRTEQPLGRRRAALLIMSLGSSLSRLLRTQVHSVLKKAVHSVAVIGAPFSGGQVRTETWCCGAESQPLRTWRKRGGGVVGRVRKREGTNW